MEESSMDISTVAVYRAVTVRRTVTGTPTKFTLHYAAQRHNLLEEAQT